MNVLVGMLQIYITSTLPTVNGVHAYHYSGTKPMTLLSNQHVGITIIAIILSCTCTWSYRNTNGVGMAMAQYLIDSQASMDSFEGVTHINGSLYIDGAYGMLYPSALLPITTDIID
jgi:hypothetical protein